MLLKYTGLKSFQPYMDKMGSPPGICSMFLPDSRKHSNFFIDYENVGVYSSALLDAYMDYKVMRRSIQQSLYRITEILVNC